MCFPEVISAESLLEFIYLGKVELIRNATSNYTAQTKLTRSAQMSKRLKNSVPVSKRVILLLL